MKLMSTLLFASLLLTACGKNNSSGHSKSKGSNFLEANNNPSLMGLSDAEILSLKYGNSISLVCEYRLQPGNSINLKKAPNSRMIWNIPSELRREQLANVTVGNVITEIKMRPVNFRIVDQNTHIDPETNHEYFMEHTPIVKMSYSANSTFVGNGRSNSNSSGRWDLFEKISRSMFSGRITLPGHVDDLRCVVNTTINPNYRHHFRQIR